METAAKDSFTIRSVGILRFDVCTNWKAIDEMHVPIFGTLANATFKCVQINCNEGDVDEGETNY